MITKATNFKIQSTIICWHCGKETSDYVSIWPSDWMPNPYDNINFCFDCASIIGKRAIISANEAWKINKHKKEG